MERATLNRIGSPPKSEIGPSQERHLLEEEMAHLETKARLTARNQFLAIVSHDLRNPLTAVSMGLEILKDKLSSAGSNQNDSTDLIEVIQRNVQAMERLITDLSDLEKLDGDKLKVTLKKQSVAEILEQCEALFSPIAARNYVTLQIEAGDKQLYANVDHDRILQVLSHVLRNSFKYTRPGGKISIDAYSMGREIEFVVADTGSGLPLDEQFRIFDKMSQAVHDTRKGIGLGLYIAKWIIEAHGGKLTVSSKAGQGNTFTFTVPVHH